jgi:hypothetical protein
MLDNGTPLYHQLNAANIRLPTYGYTVSVGLNRLLVKWLSVGTEILVQGDGSRPSDGSSRETWLTRLAWILLVRPGLHFWNPWSALGAVLGVELGGGLEGVFWRLGGATCAGIGWRVVGALRWSLVRRGVMWSARIGFRYSRTGDLGPADLRVYGWGVSFEGGVTWGF